MPRAAATDVILITSSEEEEGGKGRGRSTSGVRHPRHSAAADRDGVSKKRSKKRKEGEDAIRGVASGEVPRGGEENGQERKAKANEKKKMKKKKKRKENKGEKEKGATFSSPYSGDVVASGGEVSRPSHSCSVPGSGKRLVVGSEGGSEEGSNGKNTNRARKEKRKEREEEAGTVPSGEVRREGEERKAKAKKKNNNKEKEKKAIFPSPYSGDVVPTGHEVGRLSPTCSSMTSPAKRLVACSDGGGGGAGGNGIGGKNTVGVRKKKRKDLEVETSAVAGKVVRTKKVKKKDKNEEEKETKVTSPSSYAGDVVATSDEVDRPSPTCSFPMRRVKRLITDNEDGGGSGSRGGVRTSQDAVFLINKASELFLELFAQDAYTHATQEHKKAVFYKHLSSTVCDGKRYEFLSDFVPEKVRAEDALKALAEQQ